MSCQLSSRPSPEAGAKRLDMAVWRGSDVLMGAMNVCCGRKLKLQAHMLLIKLARLY